MATTPRTIRAGARSASNVVGYAESLKAAGGSVDLIDLPDIGIKGNTHMVMMDRNSDQVAEVIQKWLVGKGVCRLMRRSIAARTPLTLRLTF